MECVVAFSCLGLAALRGCGFYILSSYYLHLDELELVLSVVNSILKDRSAVPTVEKNGANCRNIHISVHMKQSANYNMATWYNPTAIYRFLALGTGINSVWLLQDAGGGY